MNEWNDKRTHEWMTNYTTRQHIKRSILAKVSGDWPAPWAPACSSAGSPPSPSWRALARCSNGPLKNSIRVGAGTVTAQLWKTSSMFPIKNCSVVICSFWLKDNTIFPSILHTTCCCDCVWLCRLSSPLRGRPAGGARPAGRSLGPPCTARGGGRPVGWRGCGVGAAQSVPSAWMVRVSNTARGTRSFRAKPTHMPCHGNATAVDVTVPSISFPICLASIIFMCSPCSRGRLLFMTTAFFWAFTTSGNMQIRITTVPAITIRWGHAITKNEYNVEWCDIKRTETTSDDAVNAHKWSSLIKNYVNA